ncbi:MAG: matrixin family metalloprotease [Dehalococcoidia bacterium]
MSRIVSRKSGFVIAAILILTLAFSLVAVGAGGKGPPPGQDEAVKAEPVRGKPVKVNGKDLSLYVFVYPERAGKGKKPPKEDSGPSPYCTDNDQNTIVPSFADAKPNGLTFKINDGSIPGDKSAAIVAIHAAFDAWDNVSDVGTYFTVEDSGGASRPAFDGINTVGWVKIVPRSVLAGAWVWVDNNTNEVVQVDVFYNAFHKWAAFTVCDAQGRYEVGNVGTHEFGHVVGLDHLSDANAYATMYPSAAKGEVRKQTLTAGDAAGYTDAGGY